MYLDVSSELLIKESLNSSLGKLLKVKDEEWTSSGNILKLNFTFDVRQVRFPKVLRIKPDVSKTSNMTSKKYVFVWGRYWEQLTMNMRAFLALVLQASLAGRSVVASMVRDSRFQMSGSPIGYYFDAGHIHDILRTYGYPSLADQDEFHKACPVNDPNYTTVHFLHDQVKAGTYTKNRFKLDDETYANVTREAKKYGWTRCSFIRKLTKQNPDSKMFCVDTTVITDWKVFERDVIKSAKCLSVVLWRGIGDTYRARFREKGLKLYSRDFFIAIKPSPDVMSEVEKFKQKFLGSKYVGVQIRGEHVAISFGLARLKQCIRLLGVALKLIKDLFHIEKVFVATDMSRYGSASWKDSVKRDVITDETLPMLQALVLTATNGFTFEQTADQAESLDRGFVALVEMTLVSQAQSLLTIGYSSFHEWTSVKFVDFHRNDLPTTWSLVKLCFDSK